MDLELVFSDVVFKGEKFGEVRPVKNQTAVVAIQDEEVFWYRERRKAGTSFSFFCLRLFSWMSRGHKV